MPNATKSKKPHHMATLAEVPCAKCGYEWVRPVVVLDPEAAETEDLPTYAACARCMKRVPEAPADAR